MRHVSIHDTKTANWHDLSAQYYLTEEDLGKNRAAACFERYGGLVGRTIDRSLQTGRAERLCADVAVHGAPHEGVCQPI